LNLPDDSFVIGLVARDNPQKDVDNFMNAAQILLERNKDKNIHFIVCGDGLSRQNNKLVDRVYQLGISKRVVLLGRQDDIPAVMSSFDIYTSSSSSEAFPMVIGEAMACERPCIVTDVGDSGYIVGDSGVVVPPRDSGALAVGLEKLLLMPTEKRLALGCRARARIVENFSLTAMVDKYINLYERLYL
jgi:glycosyltransferase involved in cell wall biosynthesis